MLKILGLKIEKTQDVIIYPLTFKRSGISSVSSKKKHALTVAKNKI